MQTRIYKTDDAMLVKNNIESVMADLGFSSGMPGLFKVTEDIYFGNYYKMGACLDHVHEVAQFQSMGREMQCMTQIHVSARITEKGIAVRFSMINNEYSVLNRDEYGAIFAILSKGLYLDAQEIDPKTIH